MKIKHLVASLFLLAGMAFGQSQFSGGGGNVQVSGTITAGDCTQFLNAHTIADAGGPCTTGGSGINIQVNGGGNLVSPANFVTGSANDGLTIVASNPTGSQVTFNLSGTYAGAVAATTLSASGAVSGTGFANYLASPPAIGATSAGAGTFTTLTDTNLITGLTGILYGNGASAVGVATATQVSTLLQGLTGCSAAGNVFTPQANDCVAPSGGFTAGGNLSGTSTSQNVIGMLFGATNFTLSTTTPPTSGSPCFGYLTSSTLGGISCGSGTFPSTAEGNDVAVGASGGVSLPNTVHSHPFVSGGTVPFATLISACPVSPTACKIIGDPGDIITVASTIVIGSFTQPVEFEDDGAAIDETITNNTDAIQVSTWGKGWCSMQGGPSSNNGCTIYTSGGAIQRSMVANAVTDGTQADFNWTGFNFYPGAGTIITRGLATIVAVEGKCDFSYNRFLGLPGVPDIDISDGFSTGDMNNCEINNNAEYANGNVGVIAIDIVSGLGTGQGGEYTISNNNGGDGLMSDGTVPGICGSGFGCFFNFDGSSAEASGVVNTSGTTVTATAGDQFPTVGTPYNGKKINIGGTIYTISTVGSATSLTLTTSAGTQTGIWYSMTALGNTGMGTHYLSNIDIRNGPYIEGAGPSVAGNGTASATGTTALASVSGTGFQTSWANVPIILGGAVYKISSCASTSACTLTTNGPSGTFSYSVGQQPAESYGYIKNVKGFGGNTVLNVGAAVNNCWILNATSAPSLGNISITGRDLSSHCATNNVQNLISGNNYAATSNDFDYSYTGNQSLPGKIIDGPETVYGTLSVGASGAGTVAIGSSGGFSSTLGSAATANNTFNFPVAVFTNGHLGYCVVLSITCTWTDAGYSFNSIPLAELATGTANSLIGYNGSGLASVVTVGSNLTLTGGTLSASGGSGGPDNRTILSKTANYGTVAADFSAASTAPTEVIYTVSSATTVTHTLPNSTSGLTSGGYQIVKNSCASGWGVYVTPATVTLDGSATVPLFLPPCFELIVTFDGSNFRSDLGQPNTSAVGGFVSPYGMPTSGLSSAALLQANRAEGFAFVIPQPVTITKLSIYVTTGVAASTGDVGIYDQGGNLITHTGSQATATSATALHTNASTAITLAPGLYVVSMCDSSNTVAFPMVNLSSTFTNVLGTTTGLIGPQQETTAGCTAGVLPATVIWAQSNGLNGIPIVAMTP
jgi:hypothetical protein